MLNIKFKEETYAIRNGLNELTIGEFEDLSKIMNDQDKNSLEKWSMILHLLGLPVEVIDNFDTFTFIDIIKEFNIFDIHESNYQEVIVLDGQEYKLNLKDDNLFITVKEMRLIEDYVKQDSKYLANMLAVLYKREDVHPNIQYDKTHIRFKSGLIRKSITADVAVPFISFLSKKLLGDYELITSN